MIVVKNIKNVNMYPQKSSISKKASKSQEKLLASKIKKLLLSNSFTCKVNIK